MAELLIRTFRGAHIRSHTHLLAILLLLAHHLHCSLDLAVTVGGTLVRVCRGVGGQAGP